MIGERWSIYHLPQQVRRRPEPGRGHRLAAQKVWPFDVSTPVNVKRAPRYKLMVLDDGGQIHTKAFSYLKVASGCPPPPLHSAITLAPIPDNKARALLSRRDTAVLFCPSAGAKTSFVSRLCHSLALPFSHRLSITAATGNPACPSACAGRVL